MILGILLTKYELPIAISGHLKKIALAQNGSDFEIVEIALE